MSDNTVFTALLPPIVLALVAVAALVSADFNQWRVGRYLFKPLAAAAFIWLALSAGALQSPYGQWLLAGLALCLVGDVCLMFDEDRSFFAGLVAFLCGHLLYAVAFVQLSVGAGGLNWTGLAGSAVPAALLMAPVLRWLLPHVPRDMKIPVTAYTAVITLMLLSAGLTLGHAGSALIIAGAWGFAVSDVAVARRQFVDPSPVNALWGTPLYFGAQLLLAGSAAFAVGL